MERREVVAESHCLIGEGPIWHPDEQALYWVDIAGKAVHRHDPIDGDLATISVDDEVGVLGLWHDTSWIAAGRRGVYRLELPSRRIAEIGDPERDQTESRFNDGKVDSAGRFWAGTMTPEGAQSGLYRVDHDLSVTRVDGPFTISNGIGWSPDDDVMYFVDSMRYVIHRYEFDAASGALANRSDLIVFDEEQGIPDGLTVDQRGDIWCAMYGASSLLRVSPNGNVREVVELPVRRPTSCIFGGPSYDVLYITSASIGLSDAEQRSEPLAGSVLAIRPDVGGCPEPRFAGTVPAR